MANASFILWKRRSFQRFGSNLEASEAPETSEALDAPEPRHLGINAQATTATIDMNPHDPDLLKLGGLEAVEEPEGVVGVEGVDYLLHIRSHY